MPPAPCRAEPISSLRRFVASSLRRFAAPAKLACLSLSVTRGMWSIVLSTGVRGAARAASPAVDTKLKIKVGKGLKCVRRCSWIDLETRRAYACELALKKVQGAI